MRKILIHFRCGPRANADRFTEGTGEQVNVGHKGFVIAEDNVQIKNFNRLIK